MNAISAEGGFPTHSPTPGTEDWLARVEKIAPVIEEAREQADHDRVTSRAVFEALRDAGIPRMWVAEEFGGERASIETGSAVIQALACLDASVAWQMGVQGAIGRLSDYLPEATSAQLFRDHDGLVVGGVNPAGHAEEVPGGYRLNGEWAFASGSAHADWLVCAAFVTENGEVRRTPRGPETRMLFVPRADAEIRDTWYTVGLRGTGSNHFTVNDVHVPEEFTVNGADMLRPPAARSSRAYPIGYYDFGPFTSASTALGIAQDAIDSFKDLAAKKTPTGATGTLAKSHVVQEKLARAEIELYTARLLLKDTARQVTALGETGGDSLTSLVRVTAATVAEKAAATVDSMYSLAGASSVYATSRLERCFRDVHSAVKHITLSPTHFEMVGQYLLGGGLQMRR
ncbi:acyl-CoA dehydrogenase family protein [Streptomyces sp. RKAG290]|uniref:acyl-CoA dehydrogenase family protein n=1 Tax=Streptomyces sp. RKAG290 TaxID=2888348 RepID=UPI002034447F|nr:acyl-CoA dehydrogenase family protein [Streptomyces sp. RKAG290]MCM2416260.1 acyl-CoA dehydrogenase [Streptomyces sp. RKAG290]